jgi:phage terminase small subunit
MPTPTEASHKMGVGKKGGGKHRTIAEVEARKEAEKGLKRKSRVIIVKPKWLKGRAKDIWYQTREQAKGLELLDNLDTHTLAVYCDAVAKYEALSQKELITDDDVKLLQSWARLIAQYADKLGFTPAARARLAKKKADEIQDNFGDEFD